MVRIAIPFWSRLTRVQRILLTVVVVVVVLFVVAVGIGGGRDKGDLSKPPGFITWLGDLIGDPPPVNLADLSGICVPVEGMPEDKVLPINGTCVLRVAPGEEDLRSLRLTAQGGVIVEAPTPRTGEVATKDIADAEELTVSVDADGADITLRCAGDSACAVQVG